MEKERAKFDTLIEHKSSVESSGNDSSKRDSSDDDDDDQVSTSWDHITESSMPPSFASPSTNTSASFTVPSPSSVTCSETTIPTKPRRSSELALQAKRARENALKQLLKDAQSKFDLLNKEKEETLNENRQLQQQLKSPREGMLVSTVGNDEEKLATIKDELNHARDMFPTLYEEYCRMESDLEATFEQNRERALRVEALERELQQTKLLVQEYKESDRTLKHSLKEALGLLQPLQMHLETAEEEKAILAKQVKLLKKHVKKYKKRLLEKQTADADTVTTAPDSPPSVQPSKS